MDRFAVDPEYDALAKRIRELHGQIAKIMDYSRIPLLVLQKSDQAYIRASGRRLHRAIYGKPVKKK